MVLTCMQEHIAHTYQATQNLVRVAALILPPFLLCHMNSGRSPGIKKCEGLCLVQLDTSIEHFWRSEQVPDPSEGQVAQTGAKHHSQEHPPIVRHHSKHHEIGHTHLHGVK